MFRKKQALVRVLDSPIKLMIRPDVILVPYTAPDGQEKVIMITGCFADITDQEAYRIAANATEKLVAA